MYRSTHTNSDFCYIKVLNIMRFKISLIVSLAALMMLQVVSVARASTVYVSLEQFEHELILGDSLSKATPSGAVIGGAFDISNDYQIRLEHGQWGDRFNIDGAMIDFDSTYSSIGVQRDLDLWSLSFNYSRVEDSTLSMNFPGLGELTQNEMTQDSLQFSISKQVPITNWMFKPSVGFQYNGSESVSFSDDTMIEMSEKQSATSGFIALNADYFLPVDNKRAWFFGGSIAWYESLSHDYELSEDVMTDDSSSRSRDTRGRIQLQGTTDGLGLGNRTVGESFGLLRLFATYQLDPKWSIDLTSSHGFAGDFNSNSYSLTLSYEFK